MLGIRPDSAVFIRPSVKFPLFQKGDKSSEICYFQTMRARNHLITFLSFPFAHVVSGGEINNSDLHLDVSSQREVPPPAHCCPSTAATQISGFSGNCMFEPEPLFGRSRWRRPCPHDSPHKRSCTHSDGLQPRAVWTSNYKAGERASRSQINTSWEEASQQRPLNQRLRVPALPLTGCVTSDKLCNLRASVSSPRKWG